MRRSAFTLVELILVMALLVIMLALVAPMLSNSVRGRGLKEEATRFVALTEYARSEAISQGVPVAVWIQAQGNQYGAEPKQGYDAAPGPLHSYAAAADIRIEVGQAKISGGRVDAASFSPDGTLSTTSAESVNFTDRHGAVVSVIKGRDAWGYEIAKAGR